MLQQVEITILTENRVVNPRLIAEQGLSFYISSPEGKFLFDTGQTGAFLQNAHNLKIDLQQLDAIVLSHGHYDHANGLYYYLKKFGQANVVCHPNIFNKKFRLMNGERMFIGLRWEEDELKRLGASFHFKTNPHHLTENILLSGEIHRITDYEAMEEHYEERVLESYIRDELHDDQALILKTHKGLVVLVGCAHSGVINTIKYAMRLTGIEEVYAVIGGMHLARASQEKIHKVVNALLQVNPRYIVPLHCTGFYAIHHLYRMMGDRVLLMNVGDRLEIA